MSDENFTIKTEMKIHVLIIVIVASITFMALILDTFHAVPTKTHCKIAATPLGCRVHPDFVGACDAIITIRVDTLTFIIHSLRGVCIVAMIIMMSMIYWHATKQIRAFHRNSFCCRPTVESNPNQHPSREHMSYLSSLYRNEIVIQTSCFVGAFCITYVPDSIIYFVVKTGGRPSSFLKYTYRYLFPLGGLFNILVYCRPKVASLQRDNPDRWWPHCFWLVLRAGGDIPDQAFLNDGNGDGDGDGNDIVQQREGRPRFSVPSIYPFGVRNEIESFDSVEAFNGRSMTAEDSALNLDLEEI